MRERVLRFGPEKRLVGILTEAREPNPRAPVVLLLGSGLVHRIGASRFHVHLARALAEQGMSTLRFDFSGIGDSEPRRDGLTFERAAIEEIRDAMDLLGVTRGINRFILAGLCSGADMAFYGAMAESRVVAIGQLDPFVYRTPYFYVARYGPRLLSLTSWRNLLAGRNVIGRKLRGAAAGQTSSDRPTPDMIPTPYWREFPPRDVVGSGLRQLVDRRIPMLAIFTMGQPEHYNHAGQYRRAFRDIAFGDLLTEVHYPDADHIFTGPAQQQRMIDMFKRWAAKVATATPRGLDPAAVPTP